MTNREDKERTQLGMNLAQKFNEETERSKLLKVVAPTSKVTWQTESEPPLEIDGARDSRLEVAMQKKLIKSLQNEVCLAPFVFCNLSLRLRA